MRNQDKESRTLIAVVNAAVNFKKKTLALEECESDFTAQSKANIARGGASSTGYSDMYDASDKPYMVPRRFPVAAAAVA